MSDIEMELDNALMDYETDSDATLPDLPTDTSVANVQKSLVEDVDQDIDMTETIHDEQECTPQEQRESAFGEVNAHSTVEEQLVDRGMSVQTMLPDPVKHLSKQIRRYKKVHEQAVLVRPRSRLASHRYWIAVRHPGRNSSDLEKKYVWFKGNRLTTIKTVNRMYRQHSWTDDCVLLWGGLKTCPGDRMEELDTFNDKLVVLNCVDKHDAKAGGIKMTKDLIPAASPAVVLDPMPEPITID